MSIVIFVVILLISYFIGVFGWTQIVGGFQNLKTRGSKMIITIVLWAAIIGGSFYLVFRFFRNDIWAWAIPMVISFIQVIKSGRIE